MTNNAERWRKKISDFFWDLLYFECEPKREMSERQQLFNRKQVLETLIRDCEQCIDWGTGVYHTYLLRYHGDIESIKHVQFEALLLFEVTHEYLDYVNEEIAEWLLNYGELENKPPKPYSTNWVQEWEARRAKEKERLKRKIAQKIKLPRNPQRLLTEPKHDELEFKNRVSHRHGWGEEWQPTRKRYWRPANNNWKKQNKCRKQYLVHLD